MIYSLDDQKMSRRGEVMLKGADLQCPVTVSLGYTVLLVSPVAHLSRHSDMDGVGKLAPQRRIDLHALQHHIADVLRHRALIGLLARARLAARSPLSGSLPSYG